MVTSSGSKRSRRGALARLAKGRPALLHVIDRHRRQAQRPAGVEKLSRRPNRGRYIRRHRRFEQQLREHTRVRGVGPHRVTDTYACHSRNRLLCPQNGMYRVHRMHTEAFELLADKIKDEPGMSPDPAACERFGVCPVTHRMKLSLTLQICSGVPPRSLLGWYGIGHGTVYSAFAVTMEALLRVLPALTLDCEDPAALAELAAGWAPVDKSGGHFRGVIGALDGYVPKIRKPRLVDTASPVDFLGRKGYYGLNVQVGVRVCVRVRVRACVCVCV